MSKPPKNTAARRRARAEEAAQIVRDVSQSPAFKQQINDYYAALALLNKTYGINAFVIAGVADLPDGTPDVSDVLLPAIAFARVEVSDPTTFNCLAETLVDAMHRRADIIEQVTNHDGDTPPRPAGTLFGPPTPGFA